MGASIALCMALCLMLMPLGSNAEARGSSMSGDYLNDTVSVIHELQETIALPKDSEGYLSAENQAVKLITDYISLYRNRQGVNESASYTTMQTALNALAGHYQNYSNRPLSDELIARLNNELPKAEKLASQGD